MIEGLTGGSIPVGQSSVGSPKGPLNNYDSDEARGGDLSVLCGPEPTAWPEIGTRKQEVVLRHQRAVLALLGNVTSKQ